jgi:hypothetical protein
MERAPAKEWQPAIDSRPNGQKGSAIGYPVVEHESEQLTIANPDEGGRVHSDGMAILRKQLPGIGLKHGKSAAQRQADAGERDKKSAISQG